MNFIGFNIEVHIKEGLPDERIDRLTEQYADEIEGFFDLFISRMEQELRKAYPGVPGLRIEWEEQ